MMKKFYEAYLNKLYKKDIDIFFGEGSKIVITSLGYSTNLKQIHMSAKLFPTNSEFAVEIFPEGLEMLIMESNFTRKIIGKKVRRNLGRLYSSTRMDG
jgi:hypothetical protein